MPQFKSFILVFLQFILAGYLLGSTTWNEIQFIAVVFLIVSIFIIAWAGFSMRKSKLQIFPEPAEQAKLITNGPYHFVRHPMYSAVLVACLGLLIQHFSWVRLGTFIFLFLVLNSKLLWEEKMLTAKFENYKAYILRTNRLIPFVY